MVSKLVIKGVFMNSNCRLRKLNIKDAPFMLEWMHDESVTGNLQTQFTSKTIDDCILFIKNSLNDKNNLHLAIVDNKDYYMGTVSLKHITDKTAEFGITVRTVAMGKGFSKYGMETILKYGFRKLGLISIFWCVSPNNKRAIRFYDKNGYSRIDMKNKNIEGYTRQQIDNYLWYESTNC
jgi:diamine N-acetyltransferase